MFGCPDCPTCNLPVLPAALTAYGVHYCKCSQRAKEQEEATRIVLAQQSAALSGAVEVLAAQNDAAFLISLGIAP